MMRLEFQEAEAIALDFIDASNGFLLLRLAGPEVVVNAVWAYLSSSDSKKQKSDSQVLIYPSWNTQDVGYVMAEKGQRYRMIRTRLPCGAVDMALIHPQLTAAEDKEHSFFLLTYDTGVPGDFFGRLNRALSIPLKREWAAWLWEIGQRPYTWQTLVKRYTREKGDNILQDDLAEETKTPITYFPGWGGARCYEVQCGGLYEECWLQIIRDHLGLGRVLKPAWSGSEKFYTHADFMIHPSPDGSSWSLRQGDKIRLQNAPSPNYLVALARRDLGEHLVILEN